METFQIIAVVFLVIYFAFVIGLSIYRRMVKTEMDYFLAARKFPPWILAISYAASWFGGASAIVSADKAYSGGLSAYFVMGGPTIISGIVLLFLAQKIRLFGPISQPEITEARYNKTARIIQAFIIWCYMIIWASSQMIGAATFVGGFFGLQYAAALLIVVTVVWFYCMFGGFKSVVTTDLGQFAWIIVALIIVFIAALVGSGGFGNVAKIVKAQERTDFFNILGNFKFSLFYIISFVFAWTISAEIWQRFSAARNVKEAKKISSGALLINIPLYCFAVVIGILAVGMFAQKPEGNIMVAIIKGHVPAVLGGVAFAGLLAALMSTMDTALNTGALVLTEDFYHRVINPKASEKSIVLFARIAVTIMAVCGVIVALVKGDLLEVLWMASDILAAGVFWPLILGMHTKWGTTSGAIASMVVGSLYVLWQNLISLGVDLPSIIPAWPGRSWPFSIFWGIVIGFVVFTVVSLLTRTASEKEKAENFFRSLKEKEV